MNSKLINQLIHIQYHECTNDKERFIASIKQLLDNTSLRKRTEQELWNLTWDKVYFAGVYTSFGRKWVNEIDAEGSLNDFNKIPDQPETPGQNRHKMKFRGVQKLAEKFSHCFAIYEDVRKAVSEMQGDIRSPESIDIIRRKLGVMPGSKEKGKLYEDLRINGKKKEVQGVKHTVILHMLTDYGFPVCKPDLWVVRWSDAFCTFSRNNNELEEYIQSSYPNFRVADCNNAYLNNPKNIHYNFLIIDYLIKKHFDETDPFFKEHDINIESQFNLYRFVDLILAKSGMSLEEGFGMNITPFNLLKDKNEPLRKKYDKFAEIVDIVMENGEKFGELALNTIDDFKRKIGINANVEITCKAPIEGSKRINGEILDVINENILIKTDSFGEVSIAFNNIDKIKLKTKKTKKTKKTQSYYDSSLNKAKKIFKIEKVEDRYVVYCSKNENKTKYPIVREKKYSHEIIQTIWNTVIEKIRLVGSDITDQKKMEVIENVVLAFQDYDFFKSQENNRDIYPQAMERIKQQEITQEIMEIDNKFSNDERAYKIEEIFSKYNSDEIYKHIVY